MTTSGISHPFGRLSRSLGNVTHALLTRLPLNYTIASIVPYDLHVLGTPPTLVLSQNQTLQRTINSAQGETQSLIYCKIGKEQ